MKALIAGAGIGGLTTALAFVQRGWDVTVLEQAEDLSEIGAGLQLSPNGMHVFRALGLEDAVMQDAFEPEALELRRDGSGETVFSLEIREEARRRWGAPYLHVHRADLVSVLAKALEARRPGALKLGAQVVRYDHDEETVLVSRQDGKTETADLLVGADGVHSKVLGQMHGAQAPRYTGCTAWRAIVPIDRLGDSAPPPTACVWAGPGRHAVTYRLRRGELANFVGVVERDDWTSDSWTEAGSRDEVLKDFAGAHPLLIRMIEQAETHYCWALLDRPPLERWSEGRVTLLGDAAHPTLPFLAQGAVMAIEDGWVLAQLCASRPDDVPEQLKAFRAARFRRTSAVQAESAANGRRFHQRTPLGAAATYTPMWIAGRFAPELIYRRQGRFYGTNVTEEFA